MELVDTHCHLHWLEAAHNLPLNTLMANAEREGVKHFLCVAISLDDVPTILSLCKEYPQVFASVGLHPNEERAQEPSVEDLVSMSNDPVIIAIGETGLDYYRTEEAQPWQHQRFRNHIRAAKATGLPLIVHTRQAQGDTMRILREEGAEQVGGVMHCFTEDMKMAEAALALGFYISLAGVVTFKNAQNVQTVAREVPLSRLLIETDCPYLAPMPYRGKPNQPAYVRHVAEKIAELKNLSVEEVAAQTTQNFLTCFSKAQIRA